MSHENELVDKIWHPFSYLLFPLSGAAFMVDALPHAAQSVILYIPIVHGVEMVREGYFGARARAHFDLSYVLPFCMVLSVLAMLEVRKLAARVVPE